MSSENKVSLEKPPLDELYHYGTKFHSGRYPWGSGEEPYQHSGDFISRCDELRKQGKSDNDIAGMFGMSSTNFRKEYALAVKDRKLRETDRIVSLKAKGYSNYKIGEIMGMNESTIRSKLDPHSIDRLKEAKNTSEFLKQQVAEKKFIDVGKGVERELNISRTKLDEAIYDLEMQGYKTFDRHIDQLTNPGKQTTYKVLCPPGTEFKDVVNSVGEIKSIVEYKSGDDGESFQPRFVYPKSMDSSRLQIRYAEDGGVEKDGVIELRRGVDDLSLGTSRYAQVRILVDNNRYLKGMAVYSDDMPDGVDVIFNTNKTKDVAKMDVLKKIKKDPDNPFGANIKDMDEGGQYYYTDKDGKKQLGLINKKSDEGDWEDWSNNLPSQFLSKQTKSLAKKQLNLAYDEKMEEYNEICSLTNPTVKKKLLESFADDCDSSAVHLKAAALPRQQYHVIVPIGTLKDDEVYAPNYKDGEKVVLIRYPHGGRFEIPELTVNNKNATARKLLGTDVVDAVGINHKVAERLSGADFDGDTVMVIPNNDGKIKSSPALRQLKDFDPKMEYSTHEQIVRDADGNETVKYINRYGDEIRVMKKQQTGKEMGKISNLITDMTLKGASPDELAKAVKHSMVVIDAEKHKLDWKRSEIENDIATLKETWQATVNPETGRVSRGASTLISRSKAEESIIKRQGLPKTNIEGTKDYDPTKPEGALLYKTHKDAYYAEPAIPGKKDPAGYKGYRLADGKKVLFDPEDKEAAEYYKPVKRVNKETGETYFTNKTGELVYRTETRKEKSTRMAETDDANTLVSTARTPMELLYADYANKMKALANQARKEVYHTGDIDYSSSAKDTYANEVDSLNHKLNEALKNKPRERAAQIAGNSKVNAMKAENPDMTKEELKKLKNQALNRARMNVGAERKLIDITDREWEAIQAGAITKNKLRAILDNADMDIVRSKATPRKTTTITKSQVNRIKSMQKTGRYTLREIATALGVSTSTVNEILKGKEQEN